MSDSVSPPTPEPPRRLDYVTKCATCQRYYPTDTGCPCSQPPAEVSRPTRPAARDAEWEAERYEAALVEIDRLNALIDALRVEVSELREAAERMQPIVDAAQWLQDAHDRFISTGKYVAELDRADAERDVRLAVRRYREGLARVVGVVADTPPALEQNASGAG